MASQLSIALEQVSAFFLVPFGAEKVCQIHSSDHDAVKHVKEIHPVDDCNKQEKQEVALVTLWEIYLN